VAHRLRITDVGYTSHKVLTQMESSFLVINRVVQRPMLCTTIKHRNLLETPFLASTSVYDTLFESSEGRHHKPGS
jgi:hypothetical protein